MTIDPRETDALVQRIRAEYLEMPGMTLRVEQVARLCGIERAACLYVLDKLVGNKFLRRRPDGAYARQHSDGLAATATLQTPRP